MSNANFLEGVVTIRRRMLDAERKAAKDGKAICAQRTLGRMKAKMNRGVRGCGRDGRATHWFAKPLGPSPSRANLGRTPTHASHPVIECIGRNVLVRAELFDRQSARL